jgi:hypothetical protein
VHRTRLIIFLLALSSAPAAAQDPAPPPPQETGPPGKPASQQLPSKPEAQPSKEPVHRFWDRTNKWLFTGVFAVRALDFASTRNMRARGRDEILLTNDVVDNIPAFVAIELGATAASIGVSYWLHRTGHHSLERWVSIVHISVGGFGGVRNYMLETRRPAPAPAALRISLSFRH